MNFYKHVLLTLTLFILLENVGKIGQDLSFGPDNRGDPQRSLSSGCVHFTLTPATLILMFGQQSATSCSSVFPCLSSSKANRRLYFLMSLCCYLLAEKKEVGWTLSLQQTESVPSCTHSKITPPTFLKFSKTNSDMPGLY